MALTTEQSVAIVGGVAVLGGVYLLSRGGGAGGGVPMFAVTGPSEATSRELIAQGTELTRIEAGRQVELADIFVSGEVRFAEIESQERISFETIRAEERIAVTEGQTREELARIIAESLNYQTDAQKEVALKEIGAQESKNIFDFFADIIGGIFSFF